MVVSVHDVAPATWAESRRLVGWLDERGIRGSLLVIPGPWRGTSLRDSPGFVRWLLDAVHRGHEPVQHGWRHEPVADRTGTTPHVHRVAARIATRGCAEFAELGRAEATRRIRLGREHLRECGIDVVGFTPPGWWASSETMEALRDEGVRYTTTRRHVVDLVAGTTLAMPAYCQRPGSPTAAIAGRIVDLAAGCRLRGARPLRLALHPADLHDPMTALRSEALLDRGARSARAVTYADLVTSRPSDLPGDQPPLLPGGLPSLRPGGLPGDQPADLHADRCDPRTVRSGDVTVGDPTRTRSTR